MPSACFARSDFQRRCSGIECFQRQVELFLLYLSVFCCFCYEEFTLAVFQFVYPFVFFCSTLCIFTILHICYAFIVSFVYERSSWTVFSKEFYTLYYGLMTNCVYLLVSVQQYIQTLQFMCFCMCAISLFSLHYVCDYAVLYMSVDLYS